MYNKTAPVRLRFATLLMLSLATCGLVASPESQEKASSSRVRPSTTLQAARPCQRDTPDLSRYGLDNVRTVLAKHDLSLGDVVSQPHSAPKGTIVGQSSKPGSPVRCGTAISITVSTGPRSVQPPPPQIVYCHVPDTRDGDVGAAQQKFAAAGLKVGGIDPEDSDRPRGTVMGQSLRAESRVPCGSTVNLRVSAGPKMCTVPNLEAGDLDAARRMLAERNLQLGKVVREISERTSGTVLDQKPGPDATTACGSTVDVVIAVPLPPVYVPLLKGQDAQSARRTLERASLTLGTIERRFADVAAGLILEQRPAADTPVQRGSTVSVWISDGPAPPAPTPPPTPPSEAPAPQTPTTPPVVPPTPGGSAEPANVVPEQKPTPIVPVAPAAPEVVVPEPPVATTPETPAANTPVVPVLAEIPNVVGRSATQAADLLRAAGFAGGALSTAPSPAAAGTVTFQRPEAGRRAAPRHAGRTRDRGARV